MTIKYNVTGAKRKELVLTIASWLGCEAKYKGAPSFAYEVDYFTIDKEGTLIFDDRADSEVIERLLEMLYDNGFEAESLPKADEEETSEVEITGLAIDVPLADFTETSLKNVFALVEAKGNLIKKAFESDPPIGEKLMDNRLNADVSFGHIRNLKLINNQKAVLTSQGLNDAGIIYGAYLSVAASEHISNQNTKSEVKKLTSQLINESLEEI